MEEITTGIDSALFGGGLGLAETPKAEKTTTDIYGIIVTNHTEIKEEAEESRKVLTEIATNTKKLSEMQQPTSGSVQVEFGSPTAATFMSYLAQVMNYPISAVDGIVKTVDQFERLSKMDGTAINTMVSGLSENLLKLRESTRDISTSIFKVAAGIGLVGLSMVLVAEAAGQSDVIVRMGMLLGVVALMGRVFKDNHSEILRGSAGLAVLGLSLWGFSELVTYNGIFKSALALGLIGIAIEGFSEVVDRRTDEILIGSATIGVLGLALWAFDELVSYEGILKSSIAFAALGASLFLFDKLVGKNLEENAVSLAILGLSTVALGLGMQFFENVSYESILKASLSVAAMGGIAMLLDTFKIDFEDAAIIGVLGLSLGAVGLGMQMFESVSLGDVAVGLAAVGGMAVIAGILSKLGRNAIMGALSIAAIGISLFPLAYGLEKITDLNLTLDDGIMIATTIGGLGAAYALMGIPVVSAAIVAGSIAVGSIGASLLFITGGLMAINTVNVTPETVANFANSIGTIKDVFVNLGDSGGMVSLLAGMAQAGLITVSTLALSAATHVLSKTEQPDQDQIDSFSYAVNGIKNVYTSFGLLDLAKMTAVAPIMLLVGTSTTLLGGAINLFTKFSTDKATVTTAVESLDAFTKGVGKTFTSFKSEQYGSIRDGIESFMGISNLMVGIAKGVSAIGNLEFVENHVVNGKIVPKSVKKLTPDDFTKVGTSVGQIINALVEPLAKVSEAKDDFSIGGITVTNPFSNKVQDGIEKMSKIGTVLDPLTNAISVFSKGSIDQSVVDNYRTTMSGIIGATSEMISGVSIPDNMEDNIDYLKSIIGIKKGLLDGLMETSLEDGQKRISGISTSVGKMTESINTVDLSKLTEMHGFFKTMQDLNESDAIEKLAEAIFKLSEALKEENGSQVPEERRTAVTRPENAQNGNVENQTIDMEEVKELLREMIDTIETGDNKIVEALEE